MSVDHDDLTIVHEQGAPTPSKYGDVVLNVDMLDDEARERLAALVRRAANQTGRIYFHDGGPIGRPCPVGFPGGESNWRARERWRMQRRAAWDGYTIAFRQGQ